MLDSNLMMAEAIMDEALRKAERERLLRVAQQQTQETGRPRRRTGILARLRTGWAKRTPKNQPRNRVDRCRPSYREA